MALVPDHKAILAEVNGKLDNDNLRPGLRIPEIQAGESQALPTDGIPGETRFYKVSAKMYWYLLFTGEETYPWTVLGGPGLYKTTEGGTEFNKNEYAYSKMPSIKVPLNMEADVEAGGLASNRSVEANQMEIQPITGPTELTSTGAVGIGIGATVIGVGNFNGANAVSYSRIALTKNNFIFLGYKSLSAKAGIWFSPWLTVKPLRVG